MWVTETLSEHRPATRKALRAAAGMTGKKGSGRFQRGTRALERSLLVARVGVTQEGPGGWPSTVYDLMSYAFPDQWEQTRGTRPEVARRSLLSRYLATVVAADESGMARLFGWPIGEIRDTFAQLGPSVREAEGTGWWMWEK